MRTELVSLGYGMESCFEISCFPSQERSQALEEDLSCTEAPFLNIENSGAQEELGTSFCKFQAVQYKSDG